MRLCPKCGKKSQEARCPDDGTATLVLAQNPDSRLTEGTEVNGRYRIGPMIGQGGFGSVYKATNIATDQDMAIKLLAVSLDGDDSDVIQRFFAEAQVTASLKHPNTIRVYDFGQTEGGALYIAMELLSGKPLNELLRKRIQNGQVLSEEETVALGVQILRSLAEAHLANLVHRDLKPHNIFLHEVEGDDPVVKVLDFGIAKRLGSNLTSTGKAFGTPTYMSPEQAQNRPLDRRSDLYSLGCLLFQCVAGRPPFEGENPLSVLLSHVTDDPPDLRKISMTAVSEGFVKVIEKSLSKNPEDRFNNAIEMRQALDACRGQQKTETLRSPRLQIGSQMSTQQELESEQTSSYDAQEVGRTAAYSVPTPHSTTPAKVANLAKSPPAGSTPAGAVPVAQMLADNPTFGFFSKAGSLVEPAPTPDVAVPDLLPAAANGKGASKAPWIAAVAIVVAAAIALGFAFGGGDKPEPVDAVNAPAKAAAAPGVGPAVKAAEAAAVGQIDAGAIAAADTAQSDEVAVEIVSEPVGALVVVDGKEIGKAPVQLHVKTSQQLSAALSLAGHHGQTVTVRKDDAPRLKVQLQPVAEEAKTDAKKAPVKKTTVKKNGGEEKSSLDERLK